MLHHFLMVSLLNQKSFSRGFGIQFRDEEQSRAFHCAFEQWKTEVNDQGALLDICLGFCCKMSLIYHINLDYWTLHLAYFLTISFICSH